MTKKRICKDCKTPAIRPLDGNYTNLFCYQCGSKSFLIQEENKNTSDKGNNHKHSHNETGVDNFELSKRKCWECGTLELHLPKSGDDPFFCYYCGCKYSQNDSTAGKTTTKKPIPKYSRYRHCSTCGSRDLYGNSARCSDCGSYSFETAISPDQNPDNYLRRLERESTGLKLFAGFGILVIFSIWLAFFGFISFAAYYLLKDLDLNFDLENGIPPYFIFLPFLGAIVVLLNNQKK